jgi:hypothetical protein
MMTSTHTFTVMAGLDPATQPARVGARRGAIGPRTRARWMAALKAAMTEYGGTP